MDSLLASYGSDDEDEDAREALSKQRKHSHPLDAQLIQSEETLVKRPRFASLPPPKASVSPPVQSIPFQSRAHDGREHSTVSKVSRVPAEPNLGASRSDSETGACRNVSPASSLFGSLPAPKSGIPARRIVEFKPPINMSLLQNVEKEEERVFQPKQPLSERSASESREEIRASGLTAILPAPKHSLGVGAVLGCGSGARKHTMETLAQGLDTSSGEIQKNSQKCESTASCDYSQYGEGITSLSSQGYADCATASIPVYHSYAGSQTDAALDQQKGHLQTWSSSTPELHNGAHAYDYQLDNQIQSELPPLEVNLSSHADGLREDPMELIFKQERRRGREDCIPIIQQVKQDDLTGSKIREDQLRTTGIAFGPSYKPISANKDKPSKLHRRKHQIGSLYFEMKQKEMELLERRAKGHLTKAETQAKYGW